MNGEIWVYVLFTIGSLCFLIGSLWMLWLRFS